MNFAEKWLTLNLTTLALGVGHLAGHTTLVENVLWLAPFAITVTATSCWQYLISRVGIAEEEDPVDGVQKLVSTRKMTAGEPTSKPIFLHETVAQVTDPLTQKASRYTDVKSTTLVTFMRDGWKLSYAWRKMHGMVLEDGLKTEVSQATWTRLTDVMADNHLIIKEPNRAIKTLYQPGQILRFVRPYPLPGNWTGWWGK